MNVITWLWGNKYHTRDVVRLQTQFKRNFHPDHSFHLFSDRHHDGLPSGVHQHIIKDLELCGRHCFCRLRMFDPQWQIENKFTGWILSLDLDLIITGALDSIFKMKNDFMMLKGVNAINPNPLNGSMIMLKAGVHPEVWNDFSLEKAGEIEFHEFPDDQGWIWHKVPDADGWQGGTRGVYAFQKPGWPGWPRHSIDLPPDARIIAFIGKRKPSNYVNLPWVKKHWLFYS